MKVKMKGSELKKVDIEFLSLVKRGANRAPFKVIKAEDGGTVEKTGLVGAVTKFFQMSDPAAKVVAVFVEKSALAKAASNLAEAGFTLDDYEMQDDCVVFKQEGFDDAREVIMVKSEATIGFAVANVGKFADVFCGSLSFDPSVEQTGFYPGPNEAMKAMQVAINVEKADSTETLDAFHAYSKQITKALPNAIAKFEAAQRGFGSGTTDSSEVAKAASAIAELILKDPHPGRKGAKDQAEAQTGSSSDAENQNPGGSTTSELPGNADDSPDDENQRKASAAKANQGGKTIKEDQTMTKAAEASSSSTSSTTTSEVEKAGKGASSSSSSSSTTTSEDGKYNFNKTAKPVVVKSGGKEFHLAVNTATGAVIKYTPGAKIPEGHTTMTEEWEQEGSNGDKNFNTDGNNKGKSADPGTQADNELKHTGAGGLKKEDLEALVTTMQTLPGLVEALAKSIAAQGEVLKAQNTRLEAVEKTAAGAVKKAEEKTVVHIGTNYDSAYENLGGGAKRVVKGETRTREQVAKAQFPERVWEGALGALESHIPGVESV
jgi:hypothetical protein